MNSFDTVICDIRATISLSFGAFVLGSQEKLL